MSRIVLFSVAWLFVGSQFAFAQEQSGGTGGQSEVDRLKAETDLLNAQTAKLKAELDAENATRQAEITRLTAEKDLLGAQNETEKTRRQQEIDKITAQKSLIEAATPNISGGRQGTVSFDDKGATSIENTVKAYEAVTELAPKIAAEIVKGRDKGVFVVLGAGDRSALTALSVFETQSKLIKSRLDELEKLKDSDGLRVPTEASEPQSAAAALALAGPAINLITGLVGLFRVDEKFVIRDETPDLRAVYGVIAQRMQGNGREIYYPEAMATGLFNDTSTVQTTVDSVSATLQKLWMIYFDRVGMTDAQTKLAEKADADIKKADTAAKLKKEIDVHVKERDDPKTTPKRKKALQELIDEKQKAIPADAITDPSALGDRKKYLAALHAFLESNKKYIALLDKVLKAGDEYVAAITKADATSTAPLMAMIGAERLRDVYKKDSNAYSIEVGVQRLSGTRKEHTNFFGTSLSFSGGVVVSYRVFNARSGQLLASDTVARTMPFTKAKE